MGRAQGCAHTPSLCHAAISPHSHVQQGCGVTIKRGMCAPPFSAAEQGARDWDAPSPLHKLGVTGGTGPTPSTSVQAAPPSPCPRTNPLCTQAEGTGGTAPRTCAVCPRPLRPHHLEPPPLPHPLPLHLPEPSQDIGGAGAPRPCLCIRVCQAAPPCVSMVGEAGGGDGTPTSCYPPRPSLST
jgi:hypothetical protein